ncbi:heterokaryon incompatibility, partial [Trematosphaeria pertusa]
MSRLVGRLFEASLDEKPTFEALSYVWGDPQSRKRIRCSGKNLSVTRSLALALNRIRNPTTSRIVWADAICINQNDVEERNHQVRLMREIYTRAKRVLVSLDTGDGSNNESMTRLTGYQIPVADVLTESVRSALRAFFGSPWFTRIWCVQEIVLARKAVV